MAILSLITPIPTCEQVCHFDLSDARVCTSLMVRSALMVGLLMGSPLMSRMVQLTMTRYGAHTCNNAEKVIRERKGCEGLNVGEGAPGEARAGRRLRAR